MRDLQSLVALSTEDMRRDETGDDDRTSRFQLFCFLECLQRFAGSFEENEIPSDKHVRHPKVALDLQRFPALLEAFLVLSDAHENFGGVIHKSRNQRFELASALIDGERFFKTTLWPQ